jgi:protein-S-isoprenylcysteine O-methyltransferase Ste14
MSSPPPGTRDMPAPAAAPSQARTTLAARLAIRLSLFFAAAASILFLTAGTWHYWQAWLFLVLVFVPVTAIYVVFLVADPAVVERRMEGDEPGDEQKGLVRWARPLFFAAFLVPGLDHRMGWSAVIAAALPMWLTVGGDFLILASILFLGWVIDYNHFAARTIHVEPGQTVIKRGPYCLIRHPLYAGSLVLWLATPLALGSLVALPAFALLIPFYVLRLLNEEKMLRRELAGYSEYCRSTPFRLIPFIW